MKKSIFFFFLLFSLPVFSQRVAIKNNLVYDALLTPNLSLEFSLGEKWTLDTQVGMNFFFYENDPTADGYKTRKWSHWLVQPEIALLGLREIQRLVSRAACAWRPDECRWDKHPFYSPEQA